jgi:hypothetical protein
MSFYDCTCDLTTSETCNTIGTLVTVALTACAFGLLTTGLVCANTGKWVPEKGPCESVFISGVLMCFIMCTLWIFYGLMYCVNNCDKQEQKIANRVKNPLTRVRVVRN